MKLLHIIGSVDPESGGPIEGILRQEEAMPNRFKREIVSLDLPSSPFLQRFPMKVHALGVTSRQSSSPLKKHGFTPKLVPWLRQNVNRFDVVIVNGLWNYSAFAASRVLPKGGTPYVVFSHGMMDPWFKRQYPLKHAVKQLSWLVGEGRLVNSADAVLFTSDEERILARKQFLPYNVKERVVGYGTTEVEGDINKQIVAFFEVCSIEKSQKFILFLSRIHEKKGCDLLINSFALMSKKRPDLHLVIAGPDNTGWTATLQAQAQSLGIDRKIYWPGMLKGDAKWGAYRSAEAFVLPSHQENFGIVVAEAMACGKPVLITDKVNIWREVVESGGGLVETDDADGVDRLLDRFSILSPEDLIRMGLKARSGFEKHFDMKRNIESLISVFRDIVPR